MPQKNKPRPLLLAEAANPEWVSVPLIGWSLAHAIMKQTNGHLVTQVRNREAILRAGLVEGEDFTAIDTEFLARPAHRLITVLRLGQNRGWTTGAAIASLTYPVFERMVWDQFKDKIESREFDLVHRITPVSPTSFSPIARRVARAGRPFVLGPLNGGVPWPPGFNAARLQEREWLSYIRNAYKLLPGRASSLKAASLILCGSRHTQTELPAAVQNRSVWFPENGIDPSRFPEPEPKPTTGPLRACFIGRLVPYKGLDILIAAAAPFLRNGELEIDVLGTGPAMDGAKALAESEAVADKVRFHGWVEHKQIHEIARQCHILSFPSIREFGGGVVLEAMAMGIVPVIVDYAGPGELVDEEVGFKAPIGDRATVIAGFHDTLATVLANRKRLPQMALNGLARIDQHYTWEKKASRVVEHYETLLASAP